MISDITNFGTLLSGRLVWHSEANPPALENGSNHASAEKVEHTVADSREKRA